MNTFIEITPSQWESLDNIAAIDFHLNATLCDNEALIKISELSAIYFKKLIKIKTHLVNPKRVRKICVDKETFKLELDTINIGFNKIHNVPNKYLESFGIYNNSPITSYKGIRLKLPILKSPIAFGCYDSLPPKAIESFSSLMCYADMRSSGFPMKYKGIVYEYHIWEDLNSIVLNIGLGLYPPDRRFYCNGHDFSIFVKRNEISKGIREFSHYMGNWILEIIPA
jgi:hypothetical protein